MPTARFPLDDNRTWGFECPRVFIPVQVQTLSRFVPMFPLLDTGAAVSLIPIPFATLTGIPFDRTSELDESDAPPHTARPVDRAPWQYQRPLA